MTVAIVLKDILANFPTLFNPIMRKTDKRKKSKKRSKPEGVILLQ
jgi:hypothetical protein